MIRNKLFRVDDEGSLVRRRPVLSDELRESFDQAPLERLAIAGLFRAAKRGTKVLLDDQAPPREAESDSALEACRQELASYLTDDVVTDNIFDDHYDADLALEPDSEGARVKRTLMRAVLVRAAAVAAERRVPIVVIVIPAAVDATPGLGGLEISREKHPRYDPRRLSREAVMAAEAAGLPVVDLWDELSCRECESRFYPRNRHWNELGQRVAAAELTRYIEALEVARIDAGRGDAAVPR